MDERSASVRTDALGGVEEAAGLADAGLSSEFDPFLPLFATQVLRRGGEVLVRRRADHLEGVLLHVGAEQGGSLFARDLPAVVALAAERAPASYFTELPAATVVEELDVWSVDLTNERVGPPLRHPVRPARPDDRDEVARLTSAIAGPLEPAWIPPLLASGATCWVVEWGGRIVGVGWAERVAGHGRVHSVLVDPRYRRLGLASDLLEARLRWLAATGARRAVSEISRDNLGSRRAAERSGMRPVGPMYLARFA